MTSGGMQILFENNILKGYKINWKVCKEMLDEIHSEY